MYIIAVPPSDVATRENGCAFGRISKLALKLLATKAAEKKKVAGLVDVGIIATFAPVGGYRPSIEPVTLATFEPVRTGRVVTLLCQPFICKYSRFETGLFGTILSLVDTGQTRRQPGERDGCLLLSHEHIDRVLNPVERFA